VEVSLAYTVHKIEGIPIRAISFSLCHGDPQRDADELIAEAVEAARRAATAVVVVATTERVESEGFDRKDLALPGRQDDLVRAVAAANPNTVVVVNAGSPVAMPWREEVSAVLLSWFPGQEGGAALADVLLGAAEPGGRLPTTWPDSLDDAPVTEVVPTDGQLSYDEGVFIGYRAWEKQGGTPAYPFGHGLGYTDWSYESLTVSPDGGSATVRLRNTGARPGREVVQLYLAPTAVAVAVDSDSDTDTDTDTDSATERPARWLAAFAGAEAAPGESVEVELTIPQRAFEIWDEESRSWSFVKGGYEVQASHSLTDTRLTAALEL
jgi:beta-glucosidase